MQNISSLYRSSIGHLQPLVKNLRWGSAVIGFILPLVIWGGYSYFSGSTTDAQAIVGEIVTVGRQDITSSIKALGTVTLANEQQLRFNQLGKVAVVHFTEGSEVKKGDIIAELDKADPGADIKQAKLALNDAALRLRELQSGVEKQKLDAQIAVRELERQLNEGYGNLPVEQEQVENEIQQAQNSVQEKEAALAKATRDLDASRGTGVRDLSVKIEEALTKADDDLDTLYTVLSGNTDTRDGASHEALEIIFIPKSQTLRNDTEWSFMDASRAYNAFRETYGSSVVEITDEAELSRALNDVINLITLISDTASNTYLLLQNAATSEVHSAADLNSLKTDANGVRTNSLSLLSSLQTLASDLTNVETPGVISVSGLSTVKEKEEGVQTAQQNLQEAQSALKIAQQKKLQGTSAADSLQRDIEKLSDDLLSKQAQMTQTDTSLDVQIRQQNSTIAQKQVALEKAQRTLEKYELVAPFDGIIRRIDFQVGDNLLADANETKYVVLENPDFLIVTVQLDQVDVVHVKEEQMAYITFDALPDQQFEGKIDIIDTTPVNTSGVVSYEVKIALEPTEHTILSGMTAKVQIVTGEKRGVLAVPNLALLTKNKSKVVRLEDGSTTLIETGITDGSYTEVLSGIQEGTRIQSINVDLGTTTTSTTGGNTNRPMGGPPF